MSLNWVFIGSDNDSSSIHHQIIISNNTCTLSIEHLRADFSEILIMMEHLSENKIDLKMWSAKLQPFYQVFTCMCWYDQSILAYDGIVSLALNLC